MQTAFGDVILKNLTNIQIKTLLTKKCIDKYWQIFQLILMGRPNEISNFIIIITIITIIIVVIVITISNHRIINIHIISNLL